MKQLHERRRCCGHAAALLFAVLSANIDRMTQIGNLQFHNFGRSRGRIVLVRKPAFPGVPARIIGTRWISFGTAVYDVSALVVANSWMKLNEVIPGGMNSALWQTLKANPELEYVDPVLVEATAVAQFYIYNFGYGSNRVVLVDQPSSAVYAPQRIGITSFIALNPAALRNFTAWFHTLPGASSAALAAFTAVPGGLGGGTLNRLRAALH